VTLILKKKTLSNLAELVYRKKKAKMEILELNLQLRSAVIRLLPALKERFETRVPFTFTRSQHCQGSSALLSWTVIWR